MPRYTIKHNQAVWEETTVWVEADSPEAALAAFPAEFDRALAAGTAAIEHDQPVEGMDADVTVYDDFGNHMLGPRPVPGTEDEEDDDDGNAEGP